MVKYENIEKGLFIRRPNRFVAEIEINGIIETVHVKNTGRLGELLIPGAEVAIQRSNDEKRKTKYDLISVYKNNLGWVNIDSLAPNCLVRQWLEAQSYDIVRPECAFGNSRLDFYAEKANEKFLIEVKGCTLEHDKIGYFPDAVSARATKHEKELSRAVQIGYHAATAFVIQMNGINEVKANADKDMAFAEAYKSASENGVETWFFSCQVEADSIEITDRFIKTDCIIAKC